MFYVEIHKPSFTDYNGATSLVLLRWRSQRREKGENKTEKYEGQKAQYVGNFLSRCGVSFKCDLYNIQ